MTDEKKTSDDTLQSELTQRGRDVWLAGLGALATVEEKGTEMFNDLVNRGRDFEKSRRERIEAAREEAEKQGEEALKRLEEAGEDTGTFLTETVDRAMERFGVPTRKEVDRLSDQVSKLSEQVDKLAAALDEGGAGDADDADDSA
jgi:poly(hydroxyalkanoate) granule-associated protein